jgi:hypothetical protein
MSIVLYFSVPIMVAALALALYCLVLLPAILQIIAEGNAAQQPSGNRVTILPLVPTIISNSDATTNSKKGSLPFTYTLSVPSSMRGTPLIVSRSISNLPTELLSAGSSRAAADLRRRRGAQSGDVAATLTTPRLASISEKQGLAPGDTLVHSVVNRHSSEGAVWKNYWASTQQQQDLSDLECQHPAGETAWCLYWVSPPGSAGMC